MCPTFPPCKILRISEYYGLSIVLLYIIFVLANFGLLALPYYVTTGAFGNLNAGLPRDVLIIMAPFAVVFLTGLVQELVPSNYHLNYGLLLFYVNILNSTNYVGMCCNKGHIS